MFTNNIDIASYTNVGGETSDSTVKSLEKATDLPLPFTLYVNIGIAKIEK